MSIPDKIKNVFIILILLTFSSCQIPSTNHQTGKTESYAVINQLIDKMDNETLVIFDLDNTIWRGKTYLSSEVRKEREDFMHQLATNAITPEQKNELENKLYREKRELVEPAIVDLIKKMQQKGVKIIALTGGQKRHDPLGIIHDYPHYFVSMLKNIDIDLSRSFTSINNYEFLEFGNPGDVPLFLDGILFGSRRPKGKVLEAFLQKINWKPTLLIVFDNDIRMVHYYEQTTKVLGIPSIIYEYTGARTMPAFDLESFKKSMQQ